MKIIIIIAIIKKDRENITIHLLSPKRKQVIMKYQKLILDYQLFWHLNVVWIDLEQC